METNRSTRIEKAEESIYKLSKFFMITIGLWKLPLTENVILQKIYSIYSVSFQAIYIMYNMSMIIKTTQISFNHSDSQNVFGLISLATFIAEINIKILVFKKTGIPFLFKHIIEEENNITVLSADEEIMKSYMKGTRFYKLTTRSGIFITAMSVYFYIMFNFYKKYTDKLSPGESFMYELWFPFNIDGNELISIIGRLILSQMGILINCTSQVVLQSLMVFITSYSQTLQISLTKLFNDNEQRKTVISRQLNILIEKHQFLIKFTTNLNDSVNFLILLQYFVDSINLAAALLQIITAKTIMEIAFSMFYFVLILSQILILAWSTNEICVQSVNIAHAIYESNWMDQSESVKKTLLIMMMRAQIPLSLNIGPFGSMDMTAGLTTLKGAYTYAGVMRQTYT